MPRDESTSDSLVLNLPAVAGNLARVRAAVTARGRELGMNAVEASDLATAASEACANVVVHAYPADAGSKPMEVRLISTDDALRLSVRDRGRGIQASDLAGGGGHLGLLLIGSLAQCFELRSARGQGTELVASFPASAN